MAEYVPTTEEVRDLFDERVGDDGAFDRWLEGHDHKVAARALKDAAKEHRPACANSLIESADRIERGA